MNYVLKRGEKEEIKMVKKDRRAWGTRSPISLGGPPIFLTWGGMPKHDNGGLTPARYQ